MLKLKFKSKALISGFILSVLFSFLNFACRCESISDKVLRLHIMANSNSCKDQDLKLKVRDRILKDFGEEFSETEDLVSAEKITKENLDLVKNLAQDEIFKNGYNYPVEAHLVRMKFDTRSYENITLPAGYYDALRITIGEGEGKNWWCVMFPPMCLPAAQSEVPISDVLNKEECKVVLGHDEYILGFKSVELLFEAKEFFKNNIENPVNEWLSSKNAKYEIGLKIFDLF